MKDKKHPNKIAIQSVPEIYCRLPTELKKAFWKMAADGSEHEFIREFFICPSEALSDTEGHSFVVHILSGEWTAFSIPYKEAVNVLHTRPGSDGSLLRSIYSSTNEREKKHGSSLMPDASTIEGN